MVSVFRNVPGEIPKKKLPKKYQKKENSIFNACICFILQTSSSVPKYTKIDLTTDDRAEKKVKKSKRKSKPVHNINSMRPIQYNILN